MTATLKQMRMPVHALAKGHVSTQVPNSDSDTIRGGLWTSVDQ